MLRLWLLAIKGATVEGVHHFVYFVGERPPDWWERESPSNVSAMVREEKPELSIGHYHNLGAEQACSEWIMKLDVDAFPNPHCFSSLLPILSLLGEREWVNMGMFYVNRLYSDYLCQNGAPVLARMYQHVMKNRKTYSASSYLAPAATNFICRRQDYLDLGGCDERFRGYGWEDYQQIYMLEKHQRGEDPLPGKIDFVNVTQRCRDEISRPKAKALWEENEWLCLLHHWHAASANPNYKNPATMHQNRQLLFDYIMAHR